MAKLTSFKVLCFDVYGTLIDWESGIITALQPLLAAAPTPFTRPQLLAAVHACEAAQQAATPGLKYHELLTAIHPHIAAALGLPAPDEAQSRAFGASVGRWPAFPDSVEALRRLGKVYKLVVLSNVDRESFAVTNAGPLEDTPFDLVITAQSQFHDHRPARDVGLRSSWIVRPGAVMGNRSEEVYDWKFDTLGEMADALDEEMKSAE